MKEFGEIMGKNRMLDEGLWGLKGVKKEDISANRAGLTIFMQKPKLRNDESI